MNSNYIEKAHNTADYYYNIGLEKAKIHDMSGAIETLERALYYNKKHKDARNLLGLVYFETGEGCKAYRHWKVSISFHQGPDNVARYYVSQMEEHPGIFATLNESARKYNLALSYARQSSDDLALIQLKKVTSINPKFVQGHLLYALLLVRNGNIGEAQKEIARALQVDPYNTMARHYLAEIGITQPEPPKPKKKAAAVKEHKQQIKPVDHYEDPDREKWKQFVYMLVGLGIGIAAMFVLVIPSVRAGVGVDYLSLKKEYKQTVEAKDSEIEELKEKNSSYKKQNKKLKKQLSVYEGEDGGDSMYDSLLKASQCYSQGDYVTCAQHLSNIDVEVLPSETAKSLYQNMEQYAYTYAADQLYTKGKSLYETWDYAGALENFEKAYEFRKGYSTLYFIAMCYKRTGNMEKAKPMFYEIINDSGDYSLIQQAANYGLELMVEDAKIEAGGGTASSETTGGQTTESSATTEDYYDDYYDGE